MRCAVWISLSKWKAPRRRCFRWTQREEPGGCQASGAGLSPSLSGRDRLPFCHLQLPSGRCCCGALKSPSLSRGETEAWAGRCCARALPAGPSRRPGRILPASAQHLVGTGRARALAWLCLLVSPVRPRSRASVSQRQPRLSRVPASRLGVNPPWLPRNFRGTMCAGVVACVLEYPLAQPGQAPNRQGWGGALC